MSSLYLIFVGEPLPESFIIQLPKERKAKGFVQIGGINICNIDKLFLLRIHKDILAWTV